MFLCTLNQVVSLLKGLNHTQELQQISIIGSNLIIDINFFHFILMKDDIFELSCLKDSLSLQTSSVYLPNMSIFKDDNFVFCDQITRERCKLAKLKQHRRANTDMHNHYQKQKEKENKEMQNLLEELRILNNIKNRRKQVLSIPKRQSQHLSTKLIEQLDKPLKKQKLGKCIRMQFDKLNQNLWAEYIKDPSTYRNIFTEINKVTNKGALNLFKVRQMKKTMDRYKKEFKREQTKLITQEVKPVNKLIKILNEEWEKMNEEISLRIRSQGHCLIDCKKQ